MRTSNPALNSKAFEASGQITNTDEVMTIQGSVNKTGLLLLVLMAAAAWVWRSFSMSSNVQELSSYLTLGAIGGLILALVTIFKKEWASVTAPLYAACEGLVLGGISAIFEMRFPGIVMQAVALTMGTLFALLAAYKSGWIKATENFKLGVISATGGICFIYLTSMILNLFGVHVPYIHEGGAIGIGFSLVVVVIAALNLVLDFDFIEKGAEAGAPKHMEWYAAFGLLVTLVWLYLEILNLLAKLQKK